MLREIRVRNLTNSLFGHMGLTYVDGGKDCTDNATNFDYDRVRLGSSVSRSSRSPWCEKVYGVPCHEALVYAPKVALQLLAIFGILFGAIYLAWYGLRHFRSKLCEQLPETCRFWLHDGKSERIGALPTIYMYAMTSFLWFGFLRGAVAGAYIVDKPTAVCPCRHCSLPHIGNAIFMYGWSDTLHAQPAGNIRTCHLHLVYHVSRPPQWPRLYRSGAFPISRNSV